MRTRKRTYQQRIFIYFFAAFTLFAISILVFQYERERDFKTSQLETSLDNITQITSKYIRHYGLSINDNFLKLDTLSKFLPQADIRITVIDMKGNVKYDNFVEDFLSMENHIQRPEFQKALYTETGGNIRHSSTTNQDFYYYARSFDDYMVRCAVVYNVEVKNFLKTERIFIFFMLGMFIIFGTLLYLVTSRLGSIINKLREFAIRAGNNEAMDPNLKLSDTEFGDIQNQFIQIYGNLQKTTDELSAEKDRLSNHLLALEEGIAFFSSGKEKILANSHFIQYINMISAKSSISAELFFEIDEVQKLIKDVDQVIQSDEPISSNHLPQFKITVAKNEKYFSVQAIVFADKSFEILISDITKPEKRRLLKQQLTSNIAHELKTPLSSIKGYLETILNNKELDTKKMKYFVERAYSQSERLNGLLNDISLLNNIEDAGDLFEFKKVKVKSVLEDVIENLEARLKEKKIVVNDSIKSKVEIYGNDSLIFSIFQNFIENSINYGGEAIEINISQYLEDKKFYYFSYSDNGGGVPEEHIHRIFERFYRIDEGRTREAGGTGLGLSIVKNAVHLHKGDISVRNREEGGLEFFFSLAKS